MRVTLIAAQSLDGFITKHDIPGAGFASAADKEYFRTALRGFDCSVMGGVTYRGSRDALRAWRDTSRLQIVMTRSPAAFDGDATPGALEFADRAPAQILASLRERGRRNCALLGGAQIHSAFLAARLVDELWLTVEPLLFGGGTPLLAQRAGAGGIRLSLHSCEQLAPGTLLLKYHLPR
jgi:dihydrofolate reductase